MQNSATSDLLARISGAPPIAAELRAIESGERPVAFSHVTEAAHAILVAAIASRIAQTLWIVCPTVRAQELLFESLLNWAPHALFLPEAEFAAVENILPDPEIAAERLALLSRVSRERGPHLVVTTRAALDQPAPKLAALKSATLRLKRGTGHAMEQLIESLGAAGYDRVAQVTTRGQFAVRGGILDVYSWQAQLPVRAEFFDDELESLREFDVDTQTSVRNLQSVDLLLGAGEERGAHVRDYIAGEHLRVGVQPTEGDEEVEVVISESWITSRRHSERSAPKRNGAEESRGGSLKVTRRDSSTALRSAQNDRREEDAGEDAAARAENGGQDVAGGEEDAGEDFAGAFHEADVGEFAIADFMLVEAKRTQFAARLQEWKRDGNRIVIYFQTEGEIERFREIMTATDGVLDEVELAEGTLARGFSFPAGKLVVLSAAELFGRYTTHGRRRLQRGEKFGANRAQIDFSELNEGDLVVHLEHGVGRFLQLMKVPAATGGGMQEVLALEFAEEAKLYVPLEQAYLVSRYVGVGKKSPQLSSLADVKWARAKKNAAASIFDYAGKMLAVQAERETQLGHAFGADTKWQSEFEHSFPYRETPDQLKAIDATKNDMEQPRSMDRLICGDVGFGKTEVAIRAAFKAVMEGKQVAVLTPTTVLAQQHFDTFRQRMLDYPVRIEMLSRFRTHAEQRKVLELLRDGGVDIVVGTHRIISGDVVFKDLGLVVIDEEQRFGVLHKEKFKELFKLVDVLTLSATPIPRTLYLSLVGVKDMSTIETPPLNRLPVETVVCGYDERIIRDAINRELERQGQVYFLHNRVQSIEKVRDRIAELCPGARVEYGHGQMEADELETVMAGFVAGKIDVLVSTTIIESGLDIPNANTIIIDRADRFGLADLYQLRGRVGRAEHKAYAYLLLPREMMTVGAARKRINAIKQYSSLGAGFRIAMRDLEIRGAGSILGTAQSGHIVAVGFDLYCQLLKQAVAQLKGEKFRTRPDVEVRLDFIATNEAEFVQLGPEARVPAFIPTSYISDTTLRIQAYRNLAQISTREQWDKLRKEWRDRFGKFPPAVDNLLTLTEIKLSAAKTGVARVEVRESKLMLTRRGDFILVGGKFPRLSSEKIGRNLAEVLELIRKI
ncbi:MAG: transcription-repair coupling factor [Chthoniobacterales bacterium]|nr:transcription-repair coupling factor [Chthoniobacterales bacterium]